MSLETPNRLAASVVFFYALEGSLPPSAENPELVIITAADGITKLETLSPSDGIPPSIENGFFITLQNKITPDIGTWSATGVFGQADLYSGFTPDPALMPLGAEPLDTQLQSEGDFIRAGSGLSEEVGLISLAMWTTPPTDTQLPVTLPIEL